MQFATMYQPKHQLFTFSPSEESTPLSSKPPIIRKRSLIQTLSLSDTKWGPSQPFARYSPTHPRVQLCVCAVFVCFCRRRFSLDHRQTTKNNYWGVPVSTLTNKARLTHKSQAAKQEIAFEFCKRPRTTVSCSPLSHALTRRSPWEALALLDAASELGL